MWKLKIAEGGDKWLTTINEHVGRQHWEFDAEAGTPEERADVERMREKFKRNRFQFRQSSDLLMRMQLRKENHPCARVRKSIKINETNEITEEAITTTLQRAISYYSTIQAHDGHWPAELAGPLFFSPMLVIQVFVQVIALYVTRAINDILSQQHKKEIIRYIYNHQNEDGGWGLHIEGHSTMFGSVLNYITLRLLGEGPEDGEDKAVERGRKWILDHGGAVGIPSWGKFLLSVLGVYEWDGCNPMSPEIWLLPDLFPIHPGKMLSYARLVYMPMSYLYGKKFVGPITGLIQSFRKEIFNEPYHEINWGKARNTFAKEDLYYPHPFIQDLLWGFLHHFTEPMLKKWPLTKLRDKALKVTLEHIQYEDENSRYVLCLIVYWVEDPDSESYKRHIARIPDYFWVAEDGMKLQGIGSQLWDATFSIQAILSTNLSEEYGPTLRKAHNFIKASQVALLLSLMPLELVGAEIEIEHLYDAVNIILSFQSVSGGFSAWEPRRAHSWMEKFNPTEFFEDVLIEQDHVECTSSAVQGLALFRKLHPQHRQQDIESCISRAKQYIEKTQLPDGSWYGNWGICYTYGTWFAVEGLVACGKNYHNSPALRKACKFLLSKQLPDGGWGESYLSSSNKVYTNLQGNRSTLVQTAWTLLSLIAAGQVEIDPLPVLHGMKLLINSQMEDGDFPQHVLDLIVLQ
ncbi:hypothetical protein RD792_017858 [Penstemon davidsonii]|uniref:Terpene cyclase/mutase family member n=1 Tax=Penstemon davidsonii TaxID=160366 RepID=A0ABR0DVL8_9LAMI|nr:hypothetical protein RD792_017858 [Penstemon davidsonii]